MKRRLVTAVILVALLPLCLLSADEQDEDRVRDLARAVLGPDETLAAAAAKALGRMGKDALDAAPALTIIVREKDGDLQRNAGWALRKIGADLSKPHSDFLVMIQSDSAAVRARGARALGLTYNSSPEALRELRKLVRDKSPRVRAAAADALFQLKHGNAAAMRVLRKLWSSEDPAVSHLAIEGLFIAGGQGERPAVKSLLEALESEDAKIRRLAARGLVMVTAQTDVPLEPLVRALRDESASVRVAVALAIALSKEKAVSAIPDLLIAMTDEDRAVARNAAIAIAGMKKAALPGLIEGLKSTDFRVRSCAAFVLGEMRDAPEEAIRALQRVADDDSAAVRTAARNSIRDLREGMAAGEGKDESPADPVPEEKPPDKPSAPPTFERIPVADWESLEENRKKADKRCPVCGGEGRLLTALKPKPGACHYCKAEGKLPRKVVAMRAEDLSRASREGNLPAFQNHVLVRGIFEEAERPHDIETRIRLRTPIGMPEVWCRVQWQPGAGKLFGKLTRGAAVLLLSDYIDPVLTDREGGDVRLDRCWVLRLGE